VPNGVSDSLLKSENLPTIEKENIESERTSVLNLSQKPPKVEYKQKTLISMKEALKIPKYYE